MPQKIRILSDQTINKIAAGEVIENPASVVKELVENSLDAGSSSICVEILGGGRQLIRISDDGCGMSHDDALLCLERHATSKISDVEDIQELATMGFRGEAIPSIASISKFSLLTCPHPSEFKNQQPQGTLIFVDGGKLISCSSASRSPGTTIEVKSLFFNVPVRRKFQKSPAFDTQEILKTLNLLALAYPHIQFELVSDQKSILKTYSNPDLGNLSFLDCLKKRLDCVLGKEYASSLRSLQFQHTPYELVGYIGSPTAHKPNRTGQHLFINQRWVSSPFISNAIREGYGSMLPNNRYPLFVLHLRMPGELLDVNVHPQKKEVRLRQEYQLKETILQAVQSALRSQQIKSSPPLPPDNDRPEIVPPFWAPYASLLSPSTPFKSEVKEQWEYQTKESTFFSDPPTNRALESAEIHYQSLQQPETSSTTEVPLLASHTNQPKKPSLFGFESKLTVPRVVATLFGYCVLDSFHLPLHLIKSKREGGLALLDQRAAFTRIHYEKLLKQSSRKETQALLIPETWQLTPFQSEILQENLPYLNEMGIGIRPFGEFTFVVDALPSFLKQEQIQSFLSSLIQDLVELQSSRQFQKQKEESLALAASRASLPKEKQLTIEEAQGLLQQLMACEISEQCPLGRAIFLYLAPEEIEKWFQKSGLNFKE